MGEKKGVISLRLSVAISDEIETKNVPLINALAKFANNMFKA